MKKLYDIIDMIKKVYDYEKTMQVDVKGLQIVLLVFATVLVLIDIENFKLGKLGVGVMVLLIALIMYFAVFLLRFFKREVFKLVKNVMFVVVLLVIPIATTGANDGFSILWYMLMPIITVILLGLPVGAPICVGFGLLCMVLFWTPVSGLLKYSYEDAYLFYYPIFYWGFCLLIMVMDIFYKLYQIRQLENEQSLEAEVQRTVSQTQNLMLTSVATISQMLDEKDGYTQEHSRRVAQYSKLIAENLTSESFTEEEVSYIYRSALMHDIGKIAVPDALLNKPERLTDEEYEIMKKHTIWGREILAGLKFLPQADLGACYHHECYDGSGYPNGLSGEEVPLTARIISVADALDAMNSNRCYRKQCDKDYIISEFEKGAGRQFDAELVQIVVKLIREGKIWCGGYEEHKCDSI